MKPSMFLIVLISLAPLAQAERTVSTAKAAALRFMLGMHAFTRVPSAASA